jgi:beta-lactamase superfamily II metal-dependent hydrolase
MPGNGHVVVRMYNVGFGDAFLILFPGTDRPRRVLVDCGSLIGGGGPRKISEVADAIIDDVTDADGVARIDLVIGSHRHADHVSGFENKRWHTVEVGEVWMPWTEHPTDPEATRIRETQSRLAARLTAALAASTSAEGRFAHMLAANSLKNAKAMAMLHGGFANAPKPKFLPGKAPYSVRKPARLPGVRVHVMGPSRDPEVIRDMDPPAGRSYLALDRGAAEGAVKVAPFAPASAWDVPIGEYGRGKDTKHLKLEPRDRAYLDEQADVDLFALAVSLDKAVNGTSLVVAFEIGDACLLFPADAQWGTWHAMLSNPDAASVLARTTFWKIGHHGSHNATPKDFVELLQAAHAGGGDETLWSMVSTRSDQWDDVPHEIPRRPLLDAVGTVADFLARSDLPAEAPDAGFARHDEQVTEALVPI